MIRRSAKIETFGLFLLVFSGTKEQEEVKDLCCDE